LPAYGTKMGIDATRKWTSEGFTRPWPTKIATSPEAARRAAGLWEQIRQGWKP
jgi:4-hydroxy-3-polyprenylbenzoate decarboxylase